MTNIIPMSSSINELDNNENEINLEEILENQILYDHKFSKYLIDNKLLEDLNKTPEIDKLYTFHLNEFCNQLLVNNILGNFLHLLNLAIVFFLVVGFMLPSKFIIYHIMLSMIILIMFDITDDNNFLINKFSNQNNNITLFPISLYVSRLLFFILMIISVLGVSFPEYSIFNLINKLIMNLKKYN